MTVMAQTNSSVSFSFVTWKDLPYEKLYYKAGSKFHEFEVKAKRRSAVYKLKNRPEIMQIFEMVKDETGEATYKVIAQTKMKTASRILFFVEERTNVKDGELPVALFGIDDSIAAFPVGSFRFVNGTKSDLRVEFPGVKSALPARGMKVVQPKIPAKGGFIPVYIKDRSGKVVFESRFFGQPRGRKMVFIQPPNREGGRMQMRFLPQIIPASASN